MRSAPFASLWALARVFVKALCILALGNVIFLAAGVDPLQKLIDFNLWWLVGHGRARLIYQSDLTNGELPIEALLSSHAIAYTPKGPDEYRVVLLGDSGIAGWGVPDAESLTGQLNARQLIIGSKRLVFYNLAYPSSSVARDAVILDASQQYHPDLFIWFTTLYNMGNDIKGEQAFLQINRDRLQKIASLGGLQSWVDSNVPEDPPWPAWSAIRHPDIFAPWLTSLIYPFVTPKLGTSEVQMSKHTVPAKADEEPGMPSVTPLPGKAWDFLPLSQQIAGDAEILLVNEAFFIGSGPNSDVNYNAHYNRQVYDDYRIVLANYAKQHNIWYLDLWNVVPPEHFTDNEFHMDAAGWTIVADHLAAELQKVKGIHG